ncbi:hypothetical protein HK104_000180 [Borealophlyctis nickersoniae]|nr:hypothetical protein HK104_000180 [Borealophlyctis nickersoniae]
MLRSSNEANLTALVWAPYEGTGYPFGNDTYSAKPGTANFEALDTNRDKQLTAADDPYKAFWPGDEHVDWVGLTVYHRGAAYPWVNNSIPNGTYVQDVLVGTRLASRSNFYNEYSINRGKPMMIAETGAVHHLRLDGSTTPGPDAVTIKQTWWRQYLNATFLSEFSQLKMICLYEVIDVGVRDEDGLLLDFQVANQTKADVLNSFLEDLETVQESFVWARATANDTTWEPPTSQGGDRGSDSGDGGVTRAALSAVVIFPIVVVAGLASFAVWKRRRMQAAGDLEERRTESPSPSSRDSRGKGWADEEVDDSATIVNVELEEVGDRSVVGEDEIEEIRTSRLSDGSMGGRDGLQVVPAVEGSPWRDADPETITL